MDIQFSEQQLQVFADISGDYNPLHCDKQYAHTTQFGQRVFFGIGALCRVLGEIIDHPSHINMLQVVFNRPIFLNEKYCLELKNSDNIYSFNLRKNNVTYLRGKISTTRCNTASTASKQITLNPAASEWQGESDLGQRVYGRQQAFDLAFSELFNLDTSMLADSQLNFLLWSSYFVGMEVPGRQALYSELDVRFSSEAQDSILEFDQLTASEHPLFKVITVQGKVAVADAFKIKAFRRPEAIKISLAQIAEKVATSNCLGGRNILVTGASRGLGAALGFAFDLNGAAVMLNCRSKHSSLVDQLQHLNNSRILEGDAANPHTYADVNNIDVLILNAGPHIRVWKKGEADEGETDAFVKATLSLVKTPFECLSHKLPADGTVVLISSVFSTDPPPGLEHYGDAKRQAELWLMEQKQAFPQLRFIIVRPGRLRTDQNNSVAQSTDSLLAPEVVCTRLVDTLTQTGRNDDTEIIEII